MVEFLETVDGKEFRYEKGKRYVSMESPTSKLKDYILVRQPNSLKKQNLWSKFSKCCDGIIFRTIDRCEMSLMEMYEEDKILQK